MEPSVSLCLPMFHFQPIPSTTCRDLIEVRSVTSLVWTFWLSSSSGEHVSGG